MGRGCFGGWSGTWLSSPVSGPGFPGIPEASVSEELLSTKERSCPRPSVLSPEPRAAFLEQSREGGQWLSSPLGPQLPRCLGWGLHTHVLLTVSNLLLSLYRARNSWKLNFGCRICKSGHGALPGWE